MAPRAVGATLGFFAFTISIFAGIWVGQPVSLTLSRAIWAMFVFCIIGLVTGYCAHVVVREHIRKRESELFPDEHAVVQESTTAMDESDPGISSTAAAPKPMES